MDALQIAGRTEASSVVAIDLNPIAIQCARRAHRMLERNNAVEGADAANRLEIVEGDVIVHLETLKRDYYDRIVAPRPKEGASDGDIGNGDGGALFLEALLPVMKQSGGECHWYDFAADHELPSCDRTRSFITQTCNQQGLHVDFLHVAQVGSVAKRQFRVCLDFRIRAICS
jgi:tRNA G37 N-methylase Trm5